VSKKSLCKTSASGQGSFGESTWRTCFFQKSPHLKHTSLQGCFGDATFSFSSTASTIDPLSSIEPWERESTFSMRLYWRGSIGLRNERNERKESVRNEHCFGEGTFPFSNRAVTWSTASGQGSIREKESTRNAVAKPHRMPFFISHFPQKSLIMNGSFPENDLQLKASCGYSPNCRLLSQKSPAKRRKEGHLGFAEALWEPCKEGSGLFDGKPFSKRAPSHFRWCALC